MRLPMNVQQQSPRIGMGFAEVQGLVHAIGVAEANNTGFSSENKSKRRTDIS